MKRARFKLKSVDFEMKSVEFKVEMVHEDLIRLSVRAYAQN